MVNLWLRNHMRPGRADRQWLDFCPETVGAAEPSWWNIRKQVDLEGGQGTPSHGHMSSMKIGTMMVLFTGAHVGIRTKQTVNRYVFNEWMDGWPGSQSLEIHPITLRFTCFLPPWYVYMSATPQITITVFKEHAQVLTQSMKECHEGFQ